MEKRCVPAERQTSAMRSLQPRAFWSVLGVLLMCPYVFTISVSSRPAVAGEDDPASQGPGEQRLRVVRSAMQSCSSGLEHYCFNNGQCVLLVDSNQHFCKCEGGYYGPRCLHAELVFQPMAEEQLLLIIVCVVLLIIGLSGALYFFCKWYRKNRVPHQQKQQPYNGVQST